MVGSLTGRPKTIPLGMFSQCLWEFDLTNGNRHACDMDHLHKNVAYLSGLDGLGEVQASKATGIGQPAINKIANGKTVEPGYKTVAKLAKFYGVQMDDLVNRDLAQQGVSKYSQTGRPDPETLASAMEFLGLVSRRQVVPIDFSTDAEALLYAYDLIAQDPAGFDHAQAIGQMVEWLKARRLSNAKVDKGDADRPRGRSVRKS